MSNDLFGGPGVLDYLVAAHTHYATDQTKQKCDTQVNSWGGASAKHLHLITKSDIHSEGSKSSRRVGLQLLQHINLVGSLQ